MPALQGNDVLRCAKNRERGVVVRWRRLKPTLLKGESRCGCSRGFHDAVVEDHEQSGENADAENYPPHALGGWRRAEMLDEVSAERAGDEIADGDWQKRVAHVEALLAGRGEARDIFVVTRDLRDFA